MSTVLEVRGFSVSFPESGGGRRRVVDDVSFTLARGGCVALVGESGSGKSITGLSVPGLLPPGAVIDRGAVLLDEEGKQSTDLVRLSEGERRRVRGRRVAMIFQEPMTSLNPVLTVGEQIAEAVRLHKGLGRRAAMDAAAAALAAVGIPEPSRRVRAYPHEFSGGMRQRAMIAMALACEPSVLIADEPTTALDVTVQGQILRLLQDLRRERGLGVVLISHDLGVVSGNADEIGVMYAGRIVERGPRASVLGSPGHPYTRALLACVPKLGERRATLTTVGTSLADPASCVLASGARAWWPGHAAPEGTIESEPTRELEVGAGHAVRVWNAVTPTAPGGIPMRL